MVLGLILIPAFLGGRKEIKHRRKLKEAAAAGDTSYGEANQGSDDRTAGRSAGLLTQLLPDENNLSSAEAVAKLDESKGGMALARATLTTRRGGDVVRPGSTASKSPTSNSAFGIAPSV